MALTLVLALSMALFQQVTPPETVEQTVTVLVPEDSALGLSSDSVDSLNPTGLRPVEIPVVGSIAETVTDIEARTGIEIAIDHTYRLYGPESEPDFGAQWHLENTGQAGGLTDADTDAVAAWAKSLGTGVVVAVIDSGVDISHPEFAGRIHSARHDFVDGDNDPRPVGSGPNESHGTSVAGVIAAAANGLGITGVAPGSQIMAIRACEGGSCSTVDIANGIRFAVDRGADIVNLSLGSIVAEDPVVEAAVAYARDHDVLMVTAAGNDGGDLDALPPPLKLVPGGLPYSNILNVAASDHRDRLARFSNFGAGTVDLIAPGAGIVTTSIGGGYDVVDGTSFSAPLVAGVAALLLSSDPGIGHQELFARITAFVDRPASLSGFSASGRVNAGRVLTRFFVDTSSSLFAAAIDWLAAANITSGCNPPANVQFCPGDRVTRGEMAVFLSRAFGLPSTGSDFFDDDDGTFYEASANRLRAAGLTVGCGSRRYCGEDQIRRDEMAAMLARALSLPSGGADRFTDDAGSIFEGAINKIAAAGITVGCNPPVNDRYCPVNLVTRGEMAAFIKRSLEHAG